MILLRHTLLYHTPCRHTLVCCGVIRRAASAMLDTTFFCCRFSMLAGHAADMLTTPERRFSAAADMRAFSGFIDVAAISPIIPVFASCRFSTRR